MNYIKPKAFTICLLILILLIPLFTQRYGGFLYSFTIPFFWNIIVRKGDFSSLGITSQNLKKSLIWGIVSGVLITALCAIFIKFIVLNKIDLSNIAHQSFIVAAMERSFDGYLLMHSNSVRGLVIYFLYLIFAVGIGEEIFWRGFIQDKLAKRLTENKAVFITTVLFMLIHIHLLVFIPFKQGISFIFMIGIASVIWGYLYLNTKNIWGIAISHGVTAFITWRYLFFKV